MCAPWVVEQINTWGAERITISESHYHSCEGLAMSISLLSLVAELTIPKSELVCNEHSKVWWKSHMNSLLH
jgi:hypothetical protein